MNKFIVTEEEKNRILGMHKEAIRESINKELSEQVPPNTPNTQITVDDSKRKEIYNADMSKWNMYFNFKDKELISFRDAVMNKTMQPNQIGDYINKNFATLKSLMEKVAPEAWQGASASSFKKFGNYVGTEPGSAIGTIVDYAIDLKYKTRALLQKKAGFAVDPNTLPKNPTQYIGVLKSLGIQYTA